MMRNGNRYLLVMALFLITGCRAHLPERADRCLPALPAGAGQAVLVAAQSEPYRVGIRRYEKGDGRWRAAGPVIEGVAGRDGLAPPGEKREGDGRTPSGTFALRTGFGYEPLDTAMDYLVLKPDMIWLDDPKSPLYNRLASLEEGRGFSYEVMKRNDELYKYGIVIEYNTDPVVPGAGSAIFFHLWRDRNTPTAGCVAATETDILDLLRWLDPKARPVTVVGVPANCLERHFLP